MRLTSIIPWTGPVVAPARKDEKGGRPKSNEEERGLSGVQVQGVAPREEKPADQRPDDEPPSEHVDIKV
jgi:hypothetical protein